MRVLVCGSRDFEDRGRMFEALDGLHYTFGIDSLIEGCAKGADRLAEEWAAKHRVPNLHNPADWGQHGRGAGYIRNRQMVNRHHPELVLAFYRDRTNPSRGTTDMVEVALSKRIQVIEW